MDENENQSQPMTPPEVSQPRYSSPPPEPPRYKAKTSGLTIAFCLIISIITISICLLTVSQLQNQLSEIQDAIIGYSTEVPADFNNDEMTTVPTTNVAIENKVNTYTPSKIYEENVDAIVQIAADVEKNSFWGVVEGVASGTGFIVDSDGYILTNYHVISDSTNLQVKLYSGEEYTATVLGSNQDHDIAVLKIEAQDLPTVKLGTSSDLKVGDSIVTIGHPLDMPYSMSGGMVSATNRLISDSAGNPIYVLQTDCSLNEGNSGGPVFNMKGEVVGIANAKLAGSTIEGMGFAVPIDNAVKDYNQIKETGTVSGKAQLGVTVVTVDEATAEAFNMHVGVYVNAVAEGSSAEKAGIESGDIIIGLGDTEVTSSYELQAILQQYTAGDKTSVTLWNNGEERTVDIQLQDKTEEPTKPAESGIPDTETVVPETVNPENVPEIKIDKIPNEDMDPNSYTPFNPFKDFPGFSSKP